MSLIDIRCYGFFNHPIGLIDGILHKISFSQPVTIYIIEPLNNIETLYNDLAQIEKSNLFVILVTHEGASHNEFDILLPRLINECGVLSDHIILNSSCLHDPDSYITNIGSIVNYAGNSISAFNTLNTKHPTHHYVCLNRLDRWYRYSFVKILLDRGLTKFGKVSYIFPPADVTEDYAHLFPMTIEKAEVTRDQGYNIESDAITGAAFNVITESAYENNYKSKSTIGHTRPALTEKTYKTIALAQIPIFVAPMLTVECYRKRGFDAFDDIIDHSYDLEPNPHTRLSMVADQVEKICSMSIDNLVAMKNQQLPRFIDNFNKLKYWAYNCSAELPEWENYFKNMKVA